MWRATVITLFPEAFPGVLDVSLTGKALKQGIWSLETKNLREFGLGKHRQVDDQPSGGGAGLVLKPDVVGAALVALSPRGERFTQKTAEKWSKTQGVILVCGRFEGFDERIFNHYPLQEFSIGDMVLCGGEVAAQTMLETTVRLLPDVLGNKVSLQEESFQDNLLEHSQYTLPVCWKNLKIPSVLQSGHHNFIDKWRKNRSEVLTNRRRPDMWSDYSKNGFFEKR
jgi:tRNA (guanine37-N1)-methyltransferase